MWECQSARMPITGLTTMSHCQVMVSRMAWVGIAATYCFLGGWHSIRSTLRLWPTACMNVDLGTGAHSVSLAIPARPGLAVFFHRPAVSGHIGLCSLSPAITVKPVWPRPNRSAGPFCHAHLPLFSYLRKWHNISICVFLYVSLAPWRL